MASYTPNLNLVLPIGVEKVSRAIVNSNNTIIDGAIGGINTKITPVSLGASTLAGVKTALINLNSGMTNYTDRAVYFALSSTDGVFTANVPYIGVLHRQDANNFSCNVQGKSGQNITLGYANGTWTIDSPKDEVATLNSKINSPTKITVTASTSVTINDQNVYRLGKFVMGNVRFTLSAAKNSGEGILAGLPKGDTTLSVGTSFATCSINRADAIAIIANNSTNADVLAGEGGLTARMYIISFVYATA